MTKSFLLPILVGMLFAVGPVFGADKTAPSDPVAAEGASAALEVSKAPLRRMARIIGQLLSCRFL